MADSENREEEDGNGAKRNREAPDSKIDAAPVPIRGGGERRRKVLAAILVIALVVGGGVLASSKILIRLIAPVTLVLALDVSVGVSVGRTRTSWSIQTSAQYGLVSKENSASILSIS